MRKLILASLFLVGCPDSPKDAVRRLEYFKDSRTGICYAISIYNGVQDSSAAFTYVPCEKVPTNLLQNLP